MASLDFVRDLCEKFEEQEIQYLIISLRDYKEAVKIDVFSRIKNDFSKKEVVKAFKEIVAHLEKDNEDDSGKDSKKKK